MAFGGLVGAGGSITSAILSYKEARRQRKFIREMRRTAYQATMYDMREAGLNPILAYKSGPTSAMAASQGMTPDIGQGIASGMAAGAQISQAASAKGLRKEQAETQKQEKWRVHADKLLKSQQMGVAVDSRTLIQAQARATNAKTALDNAALPKASALADFYSSPTGQKTTVATELMRRVTGAIPVRGSIGVRR